MAPVPDNTSKTGATDNAKKRNQENASKDKNAEEKPSDATNRQENGTIDDEEDVNMEDRRIRHPPRHVLDKEGKGYSIRDIPRLHFHDIHHLEHFPASAPRLIIDATEDEFHKQAKPKPKPGGKPGEEEKGKHKVEGAGGTGKSKEEEAKEEKSGSEEKGEKEKDDAGQNGDAKQQDGADKENKDSERKDNGEKKEEGKAGAEQKDSKQSGKNKSDNPTSENAEKNSKEAKEEEPKPNPIYKAEQEHIRSLTDTDGKYPSSPVYLKGLVIEIDDKDRETPDNWVPRRTDLIRNTGRHPMNAETDLTQLMGYGLVTPSMVHYVRNHGAVPVLEWDTHTLAIDGLVNNPKTFTMDDIAAMDWINIPVTMACDGNRRKELNMIRRSQGFDWGAGGVGTAYWKGVPLHRLLTLCGGIKKGAKYVCFEGSDVLPNGAYGTSLRVEYVMDERNDVLIAYEMNGKELPPDHGYPIRTILPGMVGGRTVKWLKKITVSDKESTSWYHYNDNRLIPSHVTTKSEAERDGWYTHPDTILLDLPLQSVITSPSHNQKIPVSEVGGKVKIEGYAHSGGGRRVTMVQVSLDSGQTWEYAVKRFLQNGGRWGEKWWSWCHWSLEVDGWRLLQSKEIMVRAFDANHNPQPETLNWNLHGFQNGAVFRVQIQIDGPTEKQRAPTLHFLHPTDPTGQSDGWMQPPPSSQSSSAAPDRTIPWSEISRHTSESDCWIVLNNKVYDVSRFLSQHPGGAKPILLNAGGDATEEFESIHDDMARKMTQEYCIGKVEEGEKDDQKGAKDKNRDDERHGILTRAVFTPARLIAKECLTHDTRKFTFELPGRDQGAKLGLPVGKHIRVGAHFRDKMVVRPYTPTRPVGLDIDEDDGTFDLVVKIYFPHTDPYYPPGGLLSNYLDTMDVGDAIDIKGPEGLIEYDGHGKFNIEGEDKTFDHVSLVAGGTGITPIYQLIHAILRDESDPTVISLVFANKTMEDVLLKSEFDDFVAKSNGRLRVLYSVDKFEEGKEVPSDVHVGRVDVETLRKGLFESGEKSLALVCGPPAMIEKAVTPGLKEMGYDTDYNLYSF
ncbi:hypothetical protein HK104_003791 [Borealophlyctis nickersoniae]|nr:hypothetical protein HK104_003791 [Borealophlyctis nickersoniae]